MDTHTHTLTSLYTIAVSDQIPQNPSLYTCKCSVSPQENNISGKRQFLHTEVHAPLAESIF